jgi:multiple sugar transport system substrate-binding protein
MRKKIIQLCVVFMLTLLAACGGNGESNSSEASSKNVIKVAYPKWNEEHALIGWMDNLKKQYESQNEGVTLEIIPILGSEYETKLPLMLSNEKTAPDVIVEDSFRIYSDAAAENIAPIDVSKWEDWQYINEAIKAAVTTKDGKVYGVPYNTDTRGLWYNTNIFEKAGLPTDWNPQSWEEVITAAQTIKETVPDVIPFWGQVAKASGEATTMQTFEMLLYGTADTLYDEESGKWVVGSQGFLDSLTFIQDIYSNDLGPSLQQILTPQADSIFRKELMPNEQVAIGMNGSWIPAEWGDSFDGKEVYKFAAMPTQNGEAPGYTSMSGGWALSISAKSTKQDKAFEFIKLAVNKENNKALALEEGALSTRTDVAEEADYMSLYSNEAASKFIDFTHVRPAYEKYPEVSKEIQTAVENVAIGDLSPKQAMDAYAKAIKRIVGEENTIEK